MTHNQASSSWSSALASSFSILKWPFRAGLALTLFGYGCSYGYEAVYSIPHAVLFTTPFELLDLSGMTLVIVVSSILDPLNAWAAAVASPQLYRSTFLYFCAALVGLLVAATGRVDFVERWWARRRLHGRSRTRTPWRGRQVIRQAAFTAFLIATSTPLILTIWLCCPFVIPSIGYLATRYYLEHALDIAHRACVTDRAGLNNDYVPLIACVEIADKSAVLGRGRVIVSTSSATVLFDPVTGTSVAVANKDAVVRAIGLSERAAR